MIINMLQSHIYSSHYSIINYVGFEPIYYIINLNVVSFYIVFNEFDYIFLFDILSV